MSKRVQIIKRNNKDEIIQRYQSYEDIKSIAESLDVSATTVKNWLVGWGVFGDNIKATAAINMFLSGKTVEEISQSIGLSDSGVRGALKRSGVYKNKRTANHDSLTDLYSPNALYWLGFICGDGCVDGSGNSRAKRITMTSKDMDIIKQFKGFFGSNHKISTQTHRKNGGVFHRIGFASEKICEALESVGITENKTHTLEISDQGIVNSPDFMRGIIDADGYISKDGVKIDITTGSKKFAEQLLYSIQSAGFSGAIKTRNRPNRKVYYTVQINGGKENVKSFLRWLNYDKSKYALGRKKKLALGLIE